MNLIFYVFLSKIKGFSNVVWSIFGTPLTGTNCLQLTDTSSSGVFDFFLYLGHSVLDTPKRRISKKMYSICFFTSEMKIAFEEIPENKQS